MSSKSGEDEDAEDVGGDYDRTESTSSTDKTDGETTGDNAGDSTDVPPSPTAKGDNQTIPHFIGDKEQVLSACLVSHTYDCSMILFTNLFCLCMFLLIP